MNKIKLLKWSAFLLTILTLITVTEYSIAKYVKEINLGTLSLNVSSSLKIEKVEPVHEKTQINASSISENTVSINATAASGPYDKLVVPITGLEIGEYYQLTFDESKKSAIDYANNSQEYMYGCTVMDDYSWSKENDQLAISEPNCNGGYIWKEPFLEKGYVSSNSSDFNELTITFKATKETMYWIWELANIVNNNAIDINFSNISIRKMEWPPNTAAYVDTVNTQFNNWTYLYYDGDSWEKIDTDHPQKYLRYSYLTNTTETGIDLHIETGNGWEYFNIPIRNLTVGGKYELSFAEKTGPSDLSINTDNVYGCLIQSSPYTANKQCISVSDTGSDVCIINKSGSGNINPRSVTFTATAETMYWTWQCGGIENGEWANIQLSDIKITQIN